MSLMHSRKSVQLLIPCLVDQLYPEIGIASANLLRHFGYHVTYSPDAVCCGQPAFNAGHRAEARLVAGKCLRSLAAAKESYAIVCPSGSCTAMIRKFYPELFSEQETDEALQKSLTEIIGKTYELSEFLEKEGIDSKPEERLSAPSQAKIGFHNSCHSYRELRLKNEGRNTLCRLGGFEVTEPTVEPTCCGFGGLFSVKFESISSTMAKSRLEQFVENGTNTIVTNDPGCIMHLRSEVDRHGIDASVDHMSTALAKRLGLSVSALIPEPR